MRNPITRISRAVKHHRQMQRMPLRLEFVLTDTCNLNCKCCGHYSPLAPKEYMSLEVLEHNASHLAGTCGDEVEIAYLIGGETLLYPDIIKAMEILRRHFKTQMLHIFTNGIILPKMSEEFWQKAKELDFVMSITRYPIKFDYDAVIELCHKHGVKVEVFGDRSLENSFFRFALDPEKKQWGRLSHLRCFNRGCLSVIDNKIYPCSISGCVYHLNRSKGTNFVHEKGDYLIVDEVTSARQLRVLRDRPVPFCSYCILPAPAVKYGPSKRDAAEWVEMSVK